MENACVDKLNFGRLAINNYLEGLYNLEDSYWIKGNLPVKIRDIQPKKDKTSEDYAHARQNKKLIRLWCKRLLYKGQNVTTTNHQSSTWEKL